MTTHSPWTIDERRYPASGAMDDKALFLLRYAVLAPSNQNTQPWRFSVRGPTVDFFADPERHLPVADPDRRELHISVGCALENFLIAAEHFGLGHQVELQPDRHDPDLLARIHLEAAGEPSPERPSELFDAILERRTTRMAFENREVPADGLARFQACSRADGIRLLLIDDPEAKAWIGQVIVETDERQLADPAWQQEEERLRALGTIEESASAFRCDTEAFDSAPLFGVIVSLEDDPASRVRTGQVLERIYLTATAMGLSIQPVSQILELDAPRDVVADVLGLGAALPLQPFRLGFGDSHRRPSPRRPIEEVLVVS